MYELTVQGEFCAAHAIVIAGEREPVHGHNFRVVAAVRGERLDGEGLLVDFHAVEAALREVLGAWNNRDLNGTPPFDKVNPTAELIARTVYEQLAAKLDARGVLREELGARLVWVSVTEAPGCAVRYEPAAG